MRKSVSGIHIRMGFCLALLLFALIPETGRGENACGEWLRELERELSVSGVLNKPEITDPLYPGVRLYAYSFGTVEKRDGRICTVTLETPEMADCRDAYVGMKIDSPMAETTEWPYAEIPDNAEEDAYWRLFDPDGEYAAEWVKTENGKRYRVGYLTGKDATVRRICLRIEETAPTDVAEDGRGSGDPDGQISEGDPTITGEEIDRILNQIAERTDAESRAEGDADFWLCPQGVAFRTVHEAGGHTEKRLEMYVWSEKIAGPKLLRVGQTLETARGLIPFVSDGDDSLAWERPQGRAKLTLHCLMAAGRVKGWRMIWEEQP